MRDADDRRLAHAGMLVEHLLDLARVDVVAAADDHVLLAVDDVEVAVVVDAPDVAGAEPAVGVDRGRRRVGTAPVALHHVVPADGDLAAVQQAHLDAVHGQADRAGLALAVAAVEARDRRRLRQPVALEHRTARSAPRSRAAPRPAAPRRPRCRARSDDVSASPGWLSSAAYIVGTPSNTVARSRCDDLERPARVEAREQCQRAAGGERRVEPARLAERVEQRQRAERDGVRRRGRRARPTVSTLRTRLRCVSSAPFGSPVVPDV